MRLFVDFNDHEHCGQNLEFDMELGSVISSTSDINGYTVTILFLEWDNGISFIPDESYATVTQYVE
jgi:FKBP-type peptidyl-prolyl cis-trans isomerase 2